MTCIAVTQRVEVVQAYGERRDALDQRWQQFLHRCELLPLLCPNHSGNRQRLLDTVPVAGALLTSGNTLAAYGGDAPERDAAERHLLEFCIARRLPVIGVCRGMQSIQHFFGVALRHVHGHVASEQQIAINGKTETVNSYHDWGTTETTPDLAVWAIAEDGLVKAVRHRRLPVIGIMWHPERIAGFRRADLALFRDAFAAHTVPE